MRIKGWIVILILPVALAFHSVDMPVWGFYGHRLINRVAVFTLPLDILPFYKKNIEYVTAHSIDPDRRRHASNVEAVRHYIDLDIWAEDGYENLPRDLSAAMMKYGHLHLIDTTSSDTIRSWPATSRSLTQLFNEQYPVLLAQELSNHTITIMDDGYYQLSEEWYPSEAAKYPATVLRFTEAFSQHGIVPYHLEAYQAGLVKAFENKDINRILRLSAEIGHYIADAHVPLHTTENYNGQLSNQVGIHAFWESRVPELFAEKEYDFFVEEAQYIEDKRAFFWDIVMESHSMVADVLAIELEVKATLPRNKQYCFEERGNQQVKVECEAFAQAYQQALHGMIEQRMRQAIVAVASVWYTSWVDAGRPVMDNVPVPEFVIEAIPQAVQDSLSGTHRN